jgi:mono/diheme cytochrome c family protein
MNNEVTYILRGLLLFIVLFVTTIFFKFIASIESKPTNQEIVNVETVSPRTLSAKAIKGKELFKANCASCHALDKFSTGPGLAGAEMRWPSKKLLYMWINNWENAVATGDPYANKIKDFSTVSMSKFNLSDEEIDSILAYINESTSSQSVIAKW